MEEPGGLQSMASQRVEHNRACMHCFHFVFWFLGPKARGISAPQTGITPAPPVLEADISTPGSRGNSPACIFILQLLLDQK